MIAPTRPRNVVENFLVHLAGRGRLSTAYWGFGVGGTLLISVVAVLVAFFLLPSALREHQGALDSPKFMAFVAATYWILIAYYVLVTVLIWRNAYNVVNRIWGHLARLIVVIAIVFMIGSLLGVTSFYYPTPF